MIFTGSSGGAFVRAAAVDRAYVWERKREVGVAIIDFQGGHADALSNKPHKGLFTRPLPVEPNGKFWEMQIFILPHI